MRYYLANPIEMQNFNPATYVSPYDLAATSQLPTPSEPSETFRKDSEGEMK